MHLFGARGVRGGCSAPKWCAPKPASAIPTLMTLAWLDHSPVHAPQRRTNARPAYAIDIGGAQVVSAQQATGEQIHKYKKSPKGKKIKSAFFKPQLDERHRQGCNIMLRQLPGLRPWRAQRGVFVPIDMACGLLYNMST